jgi:hypothetical protein
MISNKTILLFDTTSIHLRTISEKKTGNMQKKSRNKREEGGT